MRAKNLDDVYGTPVQEWTAVTARLDEQHVGNELAYTVEIERYQAKVGGNDEPSDLALRVTCVYRREDDGWKLVHRHADPRVDRQPAVFVIQRS